MLDTDASVIFHQFCLAYLVLGREILKRKKKWRKRFERFASWEELDKLTAKNSCSIFRSMLKSVNFICWEILNVLFSSLNTSSVVNASEMDSINIFVSFYKTKWERYICYTFPLREGFSFIAIDIHIDILCTFCIPYTNFPDPLSLSPSRIVLRNRDRSFRLSQKDCCMSSGLF